MTDSTAKCVKCECPAHHTKAAAHTHDDLVVKSLTVKGDGDGVRVTITPEGIWVGNGQRAATIQYAQGQPVVAVYDTANGGSVGFQLALTVCPKGEPVIQVVGPDKTVTMIGLDELRTLATIEQ